MTLCPQEWYLWSSFQGILESLERDECKTLIEKYGGRVTGSISSKTSYLLAGRDGGESKLEKARDFKVKVISEDDLLQMIASRPGDDETPKKVPAVTSQPAPPPSPVKIKPVSYQNVANVEKAKATLSTPPSSTTTTAQTPVKAEVDESILMCTYSASYN